MIINLCLACRRVNPLEALRCHACGAALELQDDAPPEPLHATVHTPLAGAMRLADVLKRPTAPVAPPRRPRLPGELVLTLRNVEVPPRPDPAKQRAPMLTEELVYSDPRPRVSQPEPPAVQAQRAERRAHVRRSRQRAAAHVRGAVASEVLVLDPDGRTRDTLCGLLRGWGFGVHAVTAPEAAAGVVANRPLAAAFIDVPLDATDGGVGVDLCRRVREQNRRRGQEGTVLVLLTTSLGTVDRVRAQLAGCHDAMVKPVTRGSVARVLDARGVSMPQDARQAG